MSKRPRYAWQCPITARQQQVSDMVAEVGSNKEAAKRLDVSVTYVIQTMKAIEIKQRKQSAMESKGDAQRAKR